MTEEQEVYLFKIKSKFFREIPHPKIILKYIDDLKLRLGSNDQNQEREFFLPTQSLVQLLQFHHNETFKIKNEIASANSFEELLGALQKLLTIHEYVLKFMKSFLPEGLEFNDEKIKQTIPFDSYQLIKFISDNRIDENKITEYICKDLEGKNPDTYSLLTLACLQSRKIYKDG